MEHKHITSAALRDLCGGVSDMTLWRWLNNPDLHFPKPIYIGPRRYWREAEVLGWLEAQREISPSDSDETINPPRKSDDASSA